MRRRLVIVVSVIGLGAGLQGCSDNPDDAGGSAEGGASGSEVTLGPGDTTDLRDLGDGGAGTAELTVDGVTGDATCPSGDEPQNGTYVQADLTLVATEGTDEPTGLSSFEWFAVDEAGEETPTDPMLTALCFPPDEQLPVDWGGEEEINGPLLFDVPEGTTAVVGEVGFQDPAPRLTITVG